LGEREEEDLPEEFRSILVENGDGPGPFGAKRIGKIKALLRCAVGSAPLTAPATPDALRLSNVSGLLPGQKPVIFLGDVRRDDVNG